MLALSSKISHTVLQVESDHVFLVEAKLYVVTKVLNLSFRSTTSQANMQRYTVSSNEFDC